jgi:hypothetical protein
MEGFLTNALLISNILVVLILTTFYFSPFSKFKLNNVTKVYEWKRNREERKVTFIIYEEPNRNRNIDTPFSTKHSLIALFKDHEGHSRFTYYMRYDLPLLRADIEYLHRKLLANIRMCDILQDEGVKYPSLNTITQQYEVYNHEVKRDLSNLRRLESVYRCYKKNYICKPEYSGEERDNVITY